MKLPRWSRTSLVALAVFTLAGCKDEGVETFKAARSQYEALIRAGKSPRDPAFDEVREKLRSVPESSDARDQAQDLLAALGPSSSKLPPRPLARAASPQADGGAPSQLAAACEQLAMSLGRATEAAERERLTRALQECREALEREHATSHPHDEEPHP